MQQGNYHPSKQATVYDLQMIASNVETLFEQINRLVDAQFHDLRNQISQQEPHPQLSSQSPANNSNNPPIVLSAVPSTQGNLPTLLYTPETKQVFLRTALCRDLFQRLKRISKRWLANVSEDQRRQATKVAQAIAKAVIDLRISSITQTDLENYRARIRQALGLPYHIPAEQLRLAFSQKIRVYLQNTKNKHSKWVERWGGKLDLSQPKIQVSLKKEGDLDDDDDDLNTSDLKDESDIDLLDTIRDPKLLVKRSPPPNLTHSPAKRPMHEDNILYTSISQHVFNQAFSRVKDLSSDTLVALSAKTLQPGKEPSEQEEYAFNVALISIWIDTYQNISRKWNHPPFLQSCFGIFVDYCVQKRVFDRTLDHMSKLLVRTCLRLLAICVSENKLIRFTGDYFCKDSSNFTPNHILEWVSTQLKEGAINPDELFVLNAFNDFASSFSPELHLLVYSDHPSVVDYLFATLNISVFPAENQFSKLHMIVVLLMLCRDGVDLSDLNLPALQTLQALSTQVLDDMLSRSPIMGPNPDILKQWDFFSENW